MSDAVENLGLAEPTGSKWQNVVVKQAAYLSMKYLNEGVGYPWAGHVNEIPSPADILKADKSTMEENFGLAEPIGSEEKC